MRVNGEIRQNDEKKNKIWQSFIRRCEEFIKADHYSKNRQNLNGVKLSTN